MEGKEGNPNNEVSLDDDLETFRQTDRQSHWLLSHSHCSAQGWKTPKLIVFGHNRVFKQWNLVLLCLHLSMGSNYGRIRDSYGSYYCCWWWWWCRSWLVSAISMSSSMPAIKKLKPFVTFRRERGMKWLAQKN